ncbi:MAG TPA: hypothetical protein VFD84_06100 [Candidatus Binatia bacterium]|nr:hypothetical protein [Candidatus Binatia bacterium]
MTNLELDNQLVETLDVRACFGNVAATDPDYQYDPGSDRWFSTVINGAGTGTDLAIGLGSQPENYYACYTFGNSFWDGRAPLIDQPRLTVTGNKIAIAGDPVFP